MSFSVIELDPPDTVSYYLTGVKCQGCATKISSHLTVAIPELIQPIYAPDLKLLTVELPETVSQRQLQTIVDTLGTYQVVDASTYDVTTPTPTPTNLSLGNNLGLSLCNNLGKFYPLGLIGVYLTVSSVVYGMIHHYHWMKIMNVWMGLFYLVFSFFKLLNVSGFVGSFQKYDLVAKHSRYYAYLYPWVEVGLGVLYLVNYQILMANIITVAIFTVNLAGVSLSRYRGEQLECACLGSLLNLPLTTVTIVEDTLMIAMGVIGLVG